MKLHIFISSSYINNQIIFITGLIAGPSIQKFGWRPVAICGSVISAVGFSASSFAPQPSLLYFTYGVLTGKFCD